ncbi:MAG: DnaJ domain-containing protein [Paludibacteraceae bacterium]|nr:DnaJ domain-containing protein [Paludibacteraceae bacterium]
MQEGASDDEIKRAYHELAMQHHPDRPHNADRVKECEAMMARVNEAYEKVMG